MKTKQPMPFQSLPEDYDELCRMFLPRPIHDRVGYGNTVEVADRFAGFEDEMTDDQNDYFDLLCDLIEKYDQNNAPAPKVKAADLLRHLAKEHDLTGADISRILGKSSPLGRMILRGERKITAAHAMCLGKHFGVRADAFFS
jgi:antitoxin component HigA of HigAB toxin-antitoxin module